MDAIINFLQNNMDAIFVVLLFMLVILGIILIVLLVKTLFEK